MSRSFRHITPTRKVQQNVRVPALHWSKTKPQPQARPQPTQAVRKEVKNEQTR